MNRTGCGAVRASSDLRSVLYRCAPCHIARNDVDHVVGVQIRGYDLSSLDVQNFLRRIRRNFRRFQPGAGGNAWIKAAFT